MQAAIYCRISQDATGAGLGVARQEKDCRALCKARGWTVADVIIENDTSAYGKKRRKLYEAMLERIEAHEYEALVVWHPDRLHRSPRELETFIDLVERTGLAIATVTAGDYDLATPEGRLTARIVGSVARKEVEDRSRRLRRKHEELAENGKVAGGGRRPFGYEADRRTIRKDEAKLIRAAAKRVLAGESVRSVVIGWQDRGVESVTGAPWQPTTVKRLLMSGRISGQREHHGRIVGPAEWPGIIDPDDTLRLRSILSDPTRDRSSRTPRSYLLTGLVVCGRCQVKMSTGAVKRKGHTYPRYVCLGDRGGCGRCGIGGVPLEELITEAVLQVLDTPKLAKRSARARQAARTPEVDEVEVLQARLDTLAEMYAAGEISRPEWSTARTSIDKRLTAATSDVARAVKTAASDAYLGRGGELRKAWPSMSLGQRRAVVDAVIENIEIAPTTKANNKFDSGRVGITWRA